MARNVSHVLAHVLAKQSSIGFTSIQDAQEIQIHEKFGFISIRRAKASLLYLMFLGTLPAELKFPAEAKFSSQHWARIIVFT
jgi:hypothetical protein